MQYRWHIHRLWPCLAWSSQLSIPVEVVVVSRDTPSRRRDGTGREDFTKISTGNDTLSVKLTDLLGQTSSFKRSLRSKNLGVPH